MWLAICLVFFVLKEYQANETVENFRVGVVVEEAKKVSLINDYIFIIINKTSSVQAPEILESILNNIAVLNHTLCTEIAASVPHGRSSPTKFHVHWSIASELVNSLNRVHDKIEELKLWYPNVKGQVKRSKRAAAIIFPVISGLIGIASIALGSANAVRVGRLESLVKENKNKIIQIEKNDLEQDRKINEIITNFNKAEAVIQDNVEHINFFSKAIYIGMALNRMESDVTYLINEMKDDIDKIVLAASGMVTSNLISIKQLQDLINRVKLELGFTPLFPIDQIINYYTVMSSFITTDSIVVELPIREDMLFERYKIFPFPTHYKNKSLILDIKYDNILRSVDGYLIAETSTIKLDRCKESPMYTICNRRDLSLGLLSATNSCSKSLVIGSTNLSSCSFREVEVLSDVLITDQATYIYCRERTEIHTTCGDNKSHFYAVGHVAVSPYCDIYSGLWRLRGVTHSQVNLGPVPVHHFHLGPLQIPKDINITIGKIEEIQRSNIIFLDPASHQWVTIATIIVVVIIFIVVCGLTTLWRFLKPKTAESTKKTTQTVEEPRQLEENKYV